MSKSFYTERGPLVFFMLFIGYLIVLSPVIAYLIDPTGLTIDFSGNWYFALIPIAIFTFFLYVLTASFFKMFIRFTINKKGITIYKPPIHQRHFSLSEIKHLKLLNEEETSELVRNSIEEQEQFKETYDIIGYIKMIIEKAPAYRYYTHTATAKVTTSGPKEQIQNLNVNAGGKCLILELRNGEMFYLTPAEPGAFKAFFDANLNH